MKHLLDALFEYYTLTERQAKNAMISIGKGEVNPAQISSFLTIYNMRNITIEELLGFKNALLELCHRIDLSDFNPIDIVGTGGDEKNTFNISTTVSFIVAGTGIHVAKHGNQGVSSISGSATVLEYLGAKFSRNESVVKKQLDKSGICFLYAPLFHPAMKNVLPVRKALKTKTIFNILGPLINPCRPKKSLMGTFNLSIFRLYSYLSIKEGFQNMIIHSSDGYDEVSLTSPCKVSFRNSENMLYPNDFKFSAVSQSSISNNGSVQEAAKIMVDVLKRQSTEPQRHVSLANAALAIQMQNNNSLDEALNLAKESLDSGKAYQALKAFLSVQ